MEDSDYDREDIKKIIMATDGYGSAVHIPSILV